MGQRTTRKGKVSQTETLISQHGSLAENIVLGQMAGTTAVLLSNEVEV